VAVIFAIVPLPISGEGERNQRAAIMLDTSWTFFVRRSSLAEAGLAKPDTGNAGWQSDLALSYGRVASAERRLNLREEAVRKFRLGRASLNILEHLAHVP
jgi:hypothetical protein